MLAHKLSKEQWLPRAKDAHYDLFGNEKIEDCQNFDFAVLVTDSEEKRVCYATVKELDAKTAYMTYGGTFSSERGRGVPGFHAIVEKLKEEYLFIGFATKTSNFAMLKLGLREKFEIVGLRKIDEIPNVEFLLEAGIK